MAENAYGDGLDRELQDSEEEADGVPGEDATEDITGVSEVSGLRRSTRVKRRPGWHEDFVV